MCAWYQWRPGESACQEKSKIKGEEWGRERERMNGEGTQEEKSQRVRDK